MSSEPFFIFGSGRSGSSLLSRMLNNHSAIAVPYESHLFNTFYPWLKYYGDLANVNNQRRLVHDILATDVMHDWSPQLEAEQVLACIATDNFGGVVDAVMQAWMQTQGKTRWGEKTPKHLFYWHLIREYFPNAKVIHIVRDGRDVALSLLKARFGPKTVFAAAHSWTHYLNEILQLKSMIEPSTICEVRYEDLLENPQHVLANVCEFLGESYAPEMLDFFKNQEPYMTDARNKSNLQRPLQRDNYAKWRTQMSKDDLRVFEAVAWEMLEQFGYEPWYDAAPSLSQRDAFVYRYIEHPPRKFIAMLNNHKGHIDMLIKLRLFLRLVTIDKFSGSRFHSGLSY